MEVELVHWPGEGERLEALRSTKMLRLLLVDPDAEPPEPSGIDEDWIRLPASRQDMRSRISSLVRRAETHRPVIPVVSAGILRFADSTTALRPMEEILISALLRDPFQVMSRAALFEAGWPGQSVDRNLLDAQLVQVRRRFAEVGVGLRTIRSRGVLLEF